MYVNLNLSTFVAKVYYGTTPGHSYSFDNKYYNIKQFSSKMKESVPRPGALLQ